MTSNDANRAALFDCIRNIFFRRLAGAAQWRVSVQEDQARAALQRLGGLAAPW
jgi:hypothetical protein